MRHRGLHPYAEHIEFEQAHLLDIDLVELTHRIACGARLDRGAIEQRRIGEQDAARVHCHMPRQAVEGLHEIEERVELTPSREPPESGVA
ncbi:unannotated protein [freshwater metagenome]|uniref:Unannotated protein n=1 Tax=freshwater metagenome TaxID=449393 RepID=A0A6J7F3N9_9ZZZZ